ncbi:MAG: hypothetical protein AAFO57_00370 [Pseudomonadota bacterium]
MSNPESKRAELRQAAEELDRHARAKWQALMDQDGENLDDDGYPTDLACDRIRTWHWSDPRGWLKFVADLWYLHDWGWSEADEPDEWDAKKMVRRYHVSTAGWSGNETLIRAMQESSMLWHLVWVQSRRGGHYIFELEPATEDRR